MSTRTIVVYNPVRFTGEAWLPVFWAQAKTYYERHGKHVDQWYWAPCYADIWGDNIEQVKQSLNGVVPDVFAISLYVWNYRIAHQVAAWVRKQYPDCLIISGGPHQYYKHDSQWFKKHSHLDASLPSDSYGEICITELLDELSATNQVNWNNITDIYYPKGKSMLPTPSSKLGSRSNKKNFDYSWSAFSQQFDLLRDYINYTRSQMPRAKILSIIETTRGCPYGCTYCDWGGGINTAVVQRPLEFVKQDIDSLCQLNLTFVYFADANFGIFNERDISIVDYLAKQRQHYKQKFSIGYGGFAKTENRLPAIQRILEIDIKNQLSVLGEVKISMQSLDEDVLRRIDRKNINLDDYLQTARAAAGAQKLPVYIELIYGMPGLTLDKFYHELDLLGQRNLSIQWYPWILLPEAPAYDINYRMREGIETVTKDASWWAYEDDKSNNEIVVQTSAYTKLDYFEMLMSSCLYKMIVQGGFLKHSVSYSKQDTGQLIRLIYKNFVTKLDCHARALDQWNFILDKNNSHQGCFINVGQSNVFLGLYLAAIAFNDHQGFTVPLAHWLQEKFEIPTQLTQKDLNLAVTKENFNTAYWDRLVKNNFIKKNMGNQDPLLNFLTLFTQFHHTGSIMRGTQKLLNLVAI